MTDQKLAASYVLGTLAGKDRDAARMRAIEDQEFGRLVASWEARLAPLALADEAAPPAGLITKIEARIDASGAEHPGTFTLRAGRGDWVEASPGLSIKILHENTGLGRQTFMARLDPGARYVEHGHDQDEEIYMIEGDLIIGGLVLRAGDFHVARAGRHHPVHTTRTGCLCIISQAAGTV